MAITESGYISKRADCLARRSKLSFYLFCATLSTSFVLSIGQIAKGNVSQGIALMSVGNAAVVCLSKFSRDVNRDLNEILLAGEGLYPMLPPGEDVDESRFLNG